MSITTNFKIYNGTDLGNIFVQQASSANIATFTVTGNSAQKQANTSVYTGQNITFNSPGNYLLSLTVKNSNASDGSGGSNNNNTNYYCIVLEPYLNISPAPAPFYTSPIPQGGSHKFNGIPYNITGLFNAIASTYSIWIYTITSDTMWTANIQINAMYLGNPNQS